MSWAEVWDHRGFSQSTFKHYWNSHLNLQQLEEWEELPIDGVTTFLSDESLFSRFNDLLAECEKDETYVITTDAFWSESTWLDLGLRGYGHAGLNRRRDGFTAVTIIDIDSFWIGLKPGAREIICPIPDQAANEFGLNEAFQKYRRLVNGLLLHDRQ
jgi:hypothetical protein